MGPSSARRPLGHHPPWAMRRAMAQSSAARSAPVWPPEMIFASTALVYTVRRHEATSLIPMPYTTALLQVRRRSSKSSTLKFALARALVDLVQATPNERRFSAERVAERLLEHCWYQVGKIPSEAGSPRD